jgi:alpha-mannosidase
VIRAGYELNVPLRTMSIDPTGGPLPARNSFFSVEPSNIVIEAVKRAEDGRGVIVRMYESHGTSTSARLRPPAEFESAELTDLMERRLRRLRVGTRGIALEFGPFEIQTLRLA